MIIAIAGQAGSGKDESANFLCDQLNLKKMAFADPIKRFGFHVFGFSEDQLWGSSSKRDEVDPRFTKAKIPQGAQISENTCSKGWVDANTHIRYDSYSHDWLEDVFGIGSGYRIWDLEHWLKELARSNPELTPRDMLRSLGDWGKEAGDNEIWVDSFERSYKAVMQGYPYSQAAGIISDDQDNPADGVVVSDMRYPNEVAAVRRVPNSVCILIQRDTDRKDEHPSEHPLDKSIFDFVIDNNNSREDLFSMLGALNL